MSSASSSSSIGALVLAGEVGLGAEHAEGCDGRHGIAELVAELERLLERRAGRREVAGPDRRPAGVDQRVDEGSRVAELPRDRQRAREERAGAGEVALLHARAGEQGERQPLDPEVVSGAGELQRLELVLLRLPDVARGRAQPAELGECERRVAVEPEPPRRGDRTREHLGRLLVLARVEQLTREDDQRTDAGRRVVAGRHRQRLLEPLPDLPPARRHLPVAAESRRQPEPELDVPGGGEVENRAQVLVLVGEAVDRTPRLGPGEARPDALGELDEERRVPCLRRFPHRPGRAAPWRTRGPGRACGTAAAPTRPARAATGRRRGGRRTAPARRRTPPRPPRACSRRRTPRGGRTGSAAPRRGARGSSRSSPARSAASAEGRPGRRRARRAAARAWPGSRRC